MISDAGYYAEWLTVRNLLSNETWKDSACVERIGGTHGRCDFSDDLTREKGSKNQYLYRKKCARTADFEDLHFSNTNRGSIDVYIPWGFGRGYEV